VGSGIFIADGRGNITGHESYVFNGNPCTATVSGTYSVNSDGSGNDSITLNSGRQDAVTGSPRLSRSPTEATLLFSTTMDRGRK
jgi:hypothetical protein